MANGEWWKTASGEQFGRMANGEWRMVENSEWRMANGEWRMVKSRWQHFGTPACHF
jgi:hypothetical protein